MNRTGAEQPPTEQYKSFDPVASVNLLRFDLITQGDIHPETWQRVRDEELTYMAEGMNRPLHTEFVLKRMNGELVYFVSGEWRPYSATLIKGLETAKLEAMADPRKQFQVDRAADDLYIGYRMQALKPGQKLSWYSAFPEEELKQHGAELVSSLGYQPARRMGFMYQAIADADGNVVLHSQSVDTSDLEAFAAAMTASESGDITDMRAAYDGVLTRKHKQRFFAGQRSSESHGEENVWELMMRHGDILDYYFDQLGALARAKDMSLDQLETAKKRLTYGTWAALKERIDRNAVHADWPSVSIGMEIQGAYQVLAARGEQLLGCGGGITGEATLLNAQPGQVFDAIFGEKPAEALVWVDGTCRIDNCPTRPGKTKVAQCKVCKGCQHWFDKGQDPAKLYKGMKKAGKQAVKQTNLHEWFAPKPPTTLEKSKYSQDEVKGDEKKPAKITQAQFATAA